MRKTVSSRALFLFFLAVFAMLAAATPFLWSALDKLLIQEKKKMWDAVESTIGQKIVYDRIGSNFLETLEFQNFRVLADNGDTVLRAAAVRLHLDWGAFFSGHPENIVDKVFIINAGIDLNEDRDRALLNRMGQLIRGQPHSSGEKPGAPNSRPIRLEGFNLSGTWTSALGQVSLQRIFFLLDDEEGEYRMRLRGGFAFHLDRETMGVQTVEGSFQGELRSDHQFQRLVLQGQSGRVTSELLDLEPLRFQCILTPQRLQFSKVQDQLPLDIGFTWDREAQTFQAKLNAEKFSLDRLIRWKGGESGAQWLRTLWNGKMDFFYDLAQGNWDANLDGHAEFHTDYLPEGSQIRGKIHGNPQAVTFEDTWFETPRLQIRFDGSLEMGTWLPDGHLTLNRWDIPGYGRLSSDLQFRRSENRTELTEGSIDWELVHLRQMKGFFSRNSQQYSYALEGHMDHQGISPSVSLRGTGDWTSGKIPLEFQLSQVPFAPFLQSFQKIGIPLQTSTEVQALAADLSGEAEWQLDRGWSLKPSTIQFQDPQNPHHEGHFQLKFVNQILSIAEIGFHWDTWDLGGQAQLDFSLRQKIRWTSSWQIFGNQYGLNGTYDLASKKLNWSGNAGLEGEFRIRGERDWYLQMRADDLKLPGKGRLDFLCSASGNPDQWSSELSYLKWQGYHPLTQKPLELICHGLMNNRNIRLDQIRWSDGNGVLKGWGESSLDWSFTTPWNGKLVLSGENEESYAGNWVVHSFQDFQLQAVIRHAEIPRFWDSSLKGGFDLNLSAVMTKDHWLWNSHFSLDQAVWIKDPITLSFQAQGDGESATFHDLVFNLNPLKIQDGQGRLDWTENLWELQFRQTLPLGTGVWKALLTSQGQWKYDKDVMEVSGLLTAEDNRWNEKSLPDWNLEGHLDSNNWKIGLKNGNFQAEGFPDGRLTMVGQGDFPLKMKAQGVLQDGILDLDIQNMDFDMPTLFKAINTDFFSVSSGHLKGGVQVKGPLNDLEFWGQPVIEKFTFTDMFVRAPVGPFDCPLLLEGKRLSIPESNCGPEGQYWMISGAVLLDHIIPEKYSLQVRTQGLSMVPAEYKMTGIHAVGWLTGIFTLEGNLSSLTLGGNLTLQDTSIIMAPEDLKNVSSSPGDYFGVNADMVFNSGRRLEFLWPSQEVPLVRTVAQPAQHLSVKVDEAKSTFKLDGKIDLRAGEINYLSNFFLIREGRLTFKEDQNSFDPQLKVRAELKKRESEGPVIINLRADSRISTFSPTFDSVPYKSLEDIQILLGSPISSAGGSPEVAASLASSFGSGYLLHPVENFVKKFLGLDLFSMQTDVVKKTLLSGNGATDATGYLDNTHIYFGKYVGDDVFVQGILSFRQDYPVLGRLEPRLVMEPELQLEFQTPLYLLVWSLQPQHYDETMFVSDSTVTFKWNWSY